MLHSFKVDMISTEGTQRSLAAAGIESTEVAAYTGVREEQRDGRRHPGRACSQTAKACRIMSPLRTRGVRATGSRCVHAANWAGHL